MHPAPTSPSPELPATTRLAPSPTGALHLGNARTFAVNWALARRRGWRVLLRVEDLDTPRTKAGAAEQAIEDLRWLGLDWDQGPSFQAPLLGPGGPYTAALGRLRAAGHAYPCPATRRELQAASAPNEGDPPEPRCPGRWRPPATPPPGAPVAQRLVVPPGEVRFVDGFAGPRAFDVAAAVGDFVLWTKAGLPSYQLAVVVDDARQGVTHVVRGDDLLPSTARQLLLHERLGLGPPAYLHLPLVRGPDGRRLAKRHGDTRVASYRAAGVPAARVLALLARWSGVPAEVAGDALTPAAFAEAFDLARLPPRDVTFTAEDHAWLTARS